MKKILSSILILFLCVSLVGCENMSKQDIGTVTGAAVVKFWPSALVPLLVRSLAVLSGKIWTKRIS